VLVAKLHAKTFASATASASLDLVNTRPDPEDPTFVWTVASPTGAPVLSISSGDAAPIQAVARTPPAPPPWCTRYLLTFRQGADPGRCTMSLSAALVESEP
jgi:hypothetical protein